MLLEQELSLPCGVTLPNRICKAAMTEGLADSSDNPTSELDHLYQRWSSGGAGLLISGNVMVDRRYLERGGNMVLDQESELDAYSSLARAGKSGGSAFWMQLNHPGRQCPRTVNPKPVAPSATQLHLAGNFGRPKPLSEAEIESIIASFAGAARLAKETGFDGIQIHSAHGYLGSQFLSPLTNQRNDAWGGPLENRARFLLETVRSVRASVGRDFPIGVKLNSADFQQGGFELADCQQVAHWLGEEGIDLLEVSGGTYESLIWMDNSEQRQSTQRREAFFLEYASAIREATTVPLMITGGFRQVATMNDALASGATDMVGLARPFCVDPGFPSKLFGGTLEEAPQGERDLVLGKGWLGPRSPSKTIRALNNQGQVGWFYQQILRMARQQPMLTKKSVLGSFLRHSANERRVNKNRQFKA